MGLKLTRIRPVWLLAITASTTGLLVYLLGDYRAPDVVKYFTYLYSTIALIILCVNTPRMWRYFMCEIKSWTDSL